MNNSVKNGKYRLYYNSDGSPSFYTMEDLPGNWIGIDHQTFEQGRYDIVVRNKKIVSLSEMGISRYVRSDSETATAVRCDPYDITIISDTDPYIIWDYVSDE